MAYGSCKYDPYAISFCVLDYFLAFCKCELINQFFQASRLGGELFACGGAFLRRSAVALYDRSDLADAFVNLKDGVGLLVGYRCDLVDRLDHSIDTADYLL